MWHDPDDRLQKAVDRYEEGEVETARAMLRALDRQGVISPRIDLYLGHCHMEEDRPKAALRRYRRALALGADDVRPWIGIALCHGRLGQLPRAVEALEKALGVDEEREEVHCHLVHCHALLGNLDAAERHARRAIQGDPTCPHVYRHLAVAYLLAGRPALALVAWGQVASLEPEHPELDVGVGRCHAALGRRTEARTHYQKALSGPFAADAHVGLGELALLENRSGDAAVHYQQALLAEWDHAEARLRLAETLMEAGRLPEAWSTLQPLAGCWSPEALEKDHEIAAMAARVLRMMGRGAQGLRLLRDLWRAEPGRTEPACRLGEFLLESRRYDAAVRVLRFARRLGASPGLAEQAAPERLLARAEGRRGGRRAATRILAQAAWRWPRLIELHLDVAAAQLARGRSRAAEHSLLRAMGRAPGSASLWAAAAELALEDGRADMARLRLRHALRVDPRHGQALALLGRWHEGRHDWRRALHASRAAMRVLPTDHPVVRRHGRALLELGRAREALLPLRRYVLAAPADPEGYRWLGRALAATGDTPGARQQARLCEVARLGV